MADPIEAENLDLGTWVEGTVVFDSDVGRYIVIGENASGQRQHLDPQRTLKAYEGQQVRIIVTPFATIAKLAELVEKGELSVEQASYKPPTGSLGVGGLCEPP